MMASGHLWCCAPAVGFRFSERRLAPIEIKIARERSSANYREEHVDFAATLMRVYFTVIDRQSRLMSFVESLTNVAVGFGLAVLTQLIALPWFGVQMSMGENLALSTVFTAVSVVRSYALRRLFEALRSGALHN